MAEQPTEKTCAKCGETKPLEEYHRNKRRTDGRYPYCKPCKSADDRAYREKNRDAIAERMRRYYEENREAIAERERSYREENRDAIAARKRRWQEENREALAEYKRRYREENREAIAERMRRYNEENPHVQWTSGYRFRAAKYGFPLMIEDFTKADVIAKYGDHCAYCETGEFEELEHYTPVKAGGPHTLENVRPSCSACNRAKSDADPEEWLAEQAEFDALTEEEQNALIDAEIARWIDSDDTE